MPRALKYSVIYSRSPGGGYSAFFPAFPEITVWYPTLKECQRAAPEALQLHIDGLVALGEAPARERKIISDSVTVRVG
ncbi:MAG: type II toxin-antitoxin system HicB family antitoxin [Planctomycetes bacterium]|nr:type II toxin-antitoxin system HicB family antitoxin [Planctomycetota bacterium]